MFEVERPEVDKGADQIALMRLVLARLVRSVLLNLDDAGTLVGQCTQRRAGEGRSWASIPPKETETGMLAAELLARDVLADSYVLNATFDQPLTFAASIASLKARGDMREGECCSHTRRELCRCRSMSSFRRMISVVAAVGSSS